MYLHTPGMSMGRPHNPRSLPTAVRRFRLPGISLSSIAQHVEHMKIQLFDVSDTGWAWGFPRWSLVCTTVDEVQ